ncbi:hypothetical protein BD413DRAFT_625234 [Trametes elegans]|nr:hypothetical protein BD413DRAFT_625234 [Trametes elegans]
MRSLKAASQRAESGTQSQSGVAHSDSRPPNPVKAEPQIDDVKLDLPKSLDSLDVQAKQEALRAAVEDPKNPDIEIKKELLLSDAFVLSALSWEGINHKYAVPLPKEIAEYPLRRDYIAQMYGGNMKDVIPTPRRELLEWHGLDDWFFLSL